MHMTSSVLVKTDLDSAWAFLSNESNAGRWDRSVARADLISSPPLRVGSIVRTTAPSRMTQEFRVDEIALTFQFHGRFSFPSSPSSTSERSVRIWTRSGALTTPNKS
jgi:hypothetical protein